MTDPEIVTEKLQAVMLAAGIGRRLGRAEGEPKILLPVGGISLLARHLALLEACGVFHLTIVVGYGAHLITEALAALPTGLAITTLENPDFREGSVVSLWTARGVLRAGGPVLLMDADVLYDRRLLDRLLASAHPDCFLLDRDIEPGDEPVKLCIQDGRIVDFRKQPTEPHQWHGESVGFFRFSPETAADLAAIAETYVTDGRRSLEYEEPIRDMILNDATRFGFEDITGLPWTEIDFPEDVTRATALLPELTA